MSELLQKTMISGDAGSVTVPLTHVWCGSNIILGTGRIGSF